MGWVKGFTRGSDDWCLCKRVCELGLDKENIKSKILSTYGDRVIPKRGVLASFNDHPATTFEEIESLLKG